MAGNKLPGELTWPKLIGTTLAAVVAAWIAGHFGGLGGTMSGVAVGSVVVTFFTAFFTSTIDKSHQAIVVRTERGTVVEAPADDGTAVLPAQPEASQPTHPVVHESRWSQIDWKAVAVASLVTMAITFGAISIYESAVGRTWGANEPGTTLGNTVHGGPPTAAATETPEPTDEPTESATPSEEPTASATPTESPTPSASPSATQDPTDCPTATASASATVTPGATGTDCPTTEPTDNSSGSDGLLNP